MSIPVRILNVARPTKRPHRALVLRPPLAPTSPRFNGSYSTTTPPYSAPTFPSLLRSLKSSLSSTLLHFSPLAGKLTHLPSRSDVIIDASAAAVGDGVAFVEAEADGDICRLARDDEPDEEAYLKLVPCLDVRELPAPVSSVLVTRFAGGGVAVGFSVHHMVADGKALWRFLEAWAACCRGGTPVEASFGRAVIRHPRGEEIARRLLRSLGSALPVVSSHACREV